MSARSGERCPSHGRPSSRAAAWPGPPWPALSPMTTAFTMPASEPPPSPLRAVVLRAELLQRLARGGGGFAVGQLLAQPRDRDGRRWRADAPQGFGGGGARLAVAVFEQF